MGFTRNSCHFLSHGEKCSAWLYLPDGINKPSLVIMAHGFGGMKNCGLEPFAETFANHSLAVLLFDYRGFAESEGTPRQLISPKRHIQDYQAALTWARKQTEINQERIALWGTSFSGGHCIVVAAHDPDVSAIVIQVPFVCGLASAAPIVANNGPGYFLKSLCAALTDLWRATTSQGAYHAPLFAEPGKFAVLNTYDSKSGYESLIPPGLEVINAAPARIFMTLPLYRPTRHAGKVKCPALIIAGENDSLIPVSAVKKAAAKMHRPQYVQLPVDHFQPYLGDPFQQIVKRQTEFLKTHLQ